MHVLLAIFALIISCNSDSIPVTNPVIDLYGNLTEYSWTNTMVNWTCVVNIKDYNNDFQSAVAQVYKQCGKDTGGVVYYPAGTYEITTKTGNIEIPGNIVIRGASTGSQQAKNGKEPGNLNPTTIFKCPELIHMGIFNNDNSSNMGVVNIYSQGCAIMFWPNLKSTYKLSYQSYWYYAEEVIGAGSNKLIIGNKVQDVSLGNPQPREAWYDTVVINKTSPWPFSFSNPIAGYTDNNVLVANNLLAKTTLNIKTNIFEYKNVPYLADNHYGIDVNNILYGGVLSYTHTQNAGICNCSYNAAPFMFRKGIYL